MKYNPGAWYWSRDEEQFFGPYNTRQEAIEAGKHDRPFIIAFCKPREIRLSSFVNTGLVVDNAIELACEVASEEHVGENGEGEDVFPMPDDARVALDHYIRRAIMQWEFDHRLVWSSYYFDTIEKKETHVAP